MAKQTTETLTIASQLLADMAPGGKLFHPKRTSNLFSVVAVKLNQIAKAEGKPMEWTGPTVATLLGKAFRG